MAAARIRFAGRCRACGVALLLALVTPPALLAQSDPCLHRVEPVSVTDENGVPVSGLSASDFEATFKGKPVKISSLAVNTAPIPVVFLIDASLSMTASKAWGGYIGAARYLLQRIPQGTGVQLALFQDQLEAIAPPTADRSIWEKQIQSVSSARFRTGSTALWNSIARASRSFDPSKLGVIIALSDGDDDSSSITAQAASAALIERGVRLFTFSVVTSDSGEMPEMLGQAHRFGDIARESGGQGVVPPTDSLPKKGANDLPQNWEQALRDQTTQMFAFYRLEIELPAHLSKEQGWKLKLTDSHRGAQLLWPHKLAACRLQTQPTR